MDLKSVFDSIAEKMKIDFQYESSQIQHRLSKGKVRESELVATFLNKYLPQNIGIANGEIIATNGEVSGECDIILFEKNSCPYLLNKEGYQIFPIECVYGIIEVKSKLDSTELDKTFRNINKIKKSSQKNAGLFY